MKFDCGASLQNVFKHCCFSERERCVQLVIGVPPPHAFLNQRFVFLFTTYLCIIMLDVTSACA